jgi:DNA modification methylase
MNCRTHFAAFASALPPTTTIGPTAVLKCGDSAKVLKSILTNSVSAIICDPPYGIDFGDFDWDHGIPGFGIWRECFRVLKPGGYMVAFGSPKTSHELTTLLQKIGFVICGRLVWEYPNGTPACQPIGDEHHARVKPAHEDIILVMKPIAAETMKGHREKYGNCGLRVKDTLGDGTIKMTTSIFAYNKATTSERNIGVEHLPKRRLIERDESGRSLYKESKHPNYHPCVKPVELLAHLSLLLAEPGDTILDPFMGSGSGGLAAVCRGFNYIGIERDPGYFEVAKTRIEFALNNTGVPFPLYAKTRRAFAKTERRQASSGLNWTTATDDLGVLGLARDTSVEPLPSEYEPVEWRKRKAPAPAKPKTPHAQKVAKAKAAALPDGAVNQRVVAVGRHTEEALPVACLCPDIANLPLDGLRLVEVSPLVFHHKDAPVRKHRHEIRVKLVVRELEPEGRLLPINVPNPVANLVVPVEMNGAIELFAGGEKVADKPGVMLGELGGPGIGLVGGIGLFVKNDGQVSADREVGGVGREQGPVLPNLPLTTQVANQRPEGLAKVVLVPCENRDVMACGDQYVDGLRDEHYGAWLGDVRMDDAGVNPVGKFGDAVPSRFADDQGKVALNLFGEANLNRPLRPNINLARARRVG